MRRITLPIVERIKQPILTPVLGPRRRRRGGVIPQPGDLLLDESDEQLTDESDEPLSA